MVLKKQNSFGGAAFLLNVNSVLASAFLYIVNAVIIFHLAEGRYFVRTTYRFLNISISFSLEMGLIMKSVTILILFALSIS